MKFASVVSEIESVADPFWQANWDKSGLQVASPREEISHLGVCLDPMPQSVGKALDAGCDFILSHHPLALRLLLPNHLDNYREVLKLLLCADVPLYAAHTSLDVNLKGPAGWLGQELELLSGAPLERIDSGDSFLGYGLIGNLPKPEPFDRLVEHVLELLGLDCASIAGPEPPAMCSRVAYCCGSGGSIIGLAQNAGACLYISGDIKYHAALDARIPVMDVGHHSIEEEMMKRFAHLLAKRLPDVDVEFFPSRSPFRMACK